ncbi:MAG: FAD-dependent oxidoreductase [Kordiimonadaceae bacterium]|jgi:D-amino-acid dehydrogenase|nr:FAD-dependent oxidoreductase [Kordiimonadaceae bacterium]MBT6330408.1 FAD-dependent oxidoreductase [Kordiimonadaceae bacterium]MBT7583694.1 FAD-dependent oxidoreductase [Kordiimonadaceae bacterium]
MNSRNKNAVIIGAGIVGLSSAYRLACEGYDVTLVEQESEPALGTSHANAGQLIYNFGAMGSPSFLKNLPKTLLHPSRHGVIAAALCHPKNWPWAASFIGQCSPQQWQNNSLKLIKMANRTREALHTLKEQHDIDFNWRGEGKIIIHETEADLIAAEKTAEFQRNHGGNHQVIGRNECLELEPALKESTRKIAGGTYLADAEIGDCNLFCQKLAGVLTNKFKAKIHYDVKVEAIIREKNQIAALKTSKGMIDGDIFIMCTGVNGLKLLPDSFAGKKPIIGVKGISLTYPIGNCPPNLSATDTAGKFVVARLGDQIRVAGYAIFSDNLAINPKHVSLLAKKAKALMPEAANYDEDPVAWTGLRPQTPDDLPMIGKAGFENLYINAGHGSSGWILALGSAEELLEKINE